MDFIFLWPGHDRGLQFFDEGTQLRMAEQAIDLAWASRQPHGFPGFDLLYGIFFRIFPLTLPNLRLEVLAVMVLSVGTFVILSRRLLSCAETVSISLIYIAWQSIFSGYAYYSREANLLALLAGTALLTAFQNRPRWFYGCGALLAGSIACKFNVGILTAAAFAMALFFVDRRGLLKILAGLGSVLATIVIWSAWAHRPTALFQTMATMPVSYARALYFPMPLGWLLLLLPGLAAGLWLYQKRAALKEGQGRVLFVLMIWLPFSLLQDFPRHWIAHFLWVPLPFWILAAWTHRWIWPKPLWRGMVGGCVTFVLTAYGLHITHPWISWQTNSTRLNLANARIRVAPEYALSLEELVAWVQRQSRQDEAIFVFPAQPLFYFLCERPNATSFDNFHGGWRWQDQAIAQLQAKSPRWILSSGARGPWGLDGREQAPQIARWIDTHRGAPRRFIVDDEFEIMVGEGSPQSWEAYATDEAAKKKTGDGED